MRIPKSEPKECQRSIKHFERMLKVANHWADNNIEIREHEYAPYFFGMWKVIAGNSEHRYQFVWDAREQELSIDDARFGNHGQQLTEWESYGMRKIDTRNGEDPFDFLIRFFD